MMVVVVVVNKIETLSAFPLPGDEGVEGVEGV